MNISVESLDDNNKESEKTFGPVFMSPGGTFVRPEMPALNLTPDASLAVFTDSFSKTDDSSGMQATQGDTGLNVKSFSIQPEGVSIPPELEGQSWGVKRGEVQDLGLFGGAILVTLPSRLEDVSGVRQVPDHQEVFVDKTSDISLIVEILNHAEDISNNDAARYHFDDLAQCNSAISTEITSTMVFGGASGSSDFMQELSPAYTKCVLTGRQRVSKFRNSGKNDLDEVLIYLIVVRMPEIGTDLLISLNMPATSDTKGDSVSVMHAKRPVAATNEATVPADAFLSDSSYNVVDDLAMFGVKTLRSLCETFKIVDFSLFA